MAIVLVTVAIGIAMLALAIDGQTGWRFGTRPLASITFAGLSLAGAVLATVLPSAAVALLHGPRLAARITWALAATLAGLASIGFVELPTADTAAARQAAVVTSSAAGDQRRAAIVAAQAAATAA